MSAFTLPVDDSKPFEIIDFNVDLLASPPEIQEEKLSTLENDIFNQKKSIEINYKDAHADEGHLNIYICKFKTGKSRLHIFGKIKGQEFRTERELPENYKAILLNERIKYVLVSSRNILKTYYLSSNLKSIENHLMAFLIPY